MTDFHVYKDRTDFIAPNGRHCHGVRWILRDATGIRLTTTKTRKEAVAAVERRGGRVIFAKPDVSTREFDLDASRPAPADREESGVFRAKLTIRGLGTMKEINTEALTLTFAKIAADREFGHAQFGDIVITKNAAKTRMNPLGEVARRNVDESWENAAVATLGFDEA